MTTVFYGGAITTVKLGFMVAQALIFPNRSLPALLHRVDLKLQRRKNDGGVICCDLTSILA
jgi:hypothetical protein